MRRHTIHKLIMTTAVLLATAVAAHAQFADCSTGLLQMPTAEMQEDGTLMITNNFLNKHSLASNGWDYNTFQYGIYVSFWGRMEVGYVCTIFNEYWTDRRVRPGTNIIMVNQDRHFTGRIRLLMEEEFGLKWMPSLVVGASDPFTGSGGDYKDMDNVSGNGNGYFSRYFVVLSKHLQIPWGEIGVHAGYQYNRRNDYPINGPCVGVNWSPIWLQHRRILDEVNVIAEFDSRTVNIGFIASIWENRFEAMFELQNFQWVNFGLRYKLQIK